MRVLVVWCPDWPVAAALAEQGQPRRLPAATFLANRVQAVNAPGREFGIRRGMRRRDAQARCPELRVLAADQARDARAFERVLDELERLRPGVMPLRPGMVALRSPARFYGGEAEAGAVISEALVSLGVWDVRIGIADDLFTAEQAARTARLQECVAITDSVGFLRALPVEVLEDADAVSLLRRLGLRTLAELADLPAADIRARFGEQAAWVHRVAHGDGAVAVAGRTPSPELAVGVDFEPPLADAEAVCFSVRRTAERFVSELGSRQLVCTGVRISVETEGVVVSERTWLHPRWFAAPDLIDRLHWQLVGSPGLRRGEIRAAIDKVVLTPESVASASVHAEGLWGGTDARVERGIARVQGMLGHEAVRVPVLQGGRSPAQRQALVPWGDRPTGLRDRGLPWPGSIPPPYPARVFEVPWSAECLDPAGRPVLISERGMLSGPPARLRPGAAEPWQQLASWAGPWPVSESWWEGGGLLARFQLVGVDGRAWLVVYDAAAACWRTEAAYD